VLRYFSEINVTSESVLIFCVAKTASNLEQEQSLDAWFRFGYKDAAVIFKNNSNTFIG
jgi:hypothetical protein